MAKKLLSIGETSELLGISIDTLRQWDEKQILSSFRPSPSGNRYYRMEDIENFLKKDTKNKEENIANLAQEWATNKAPISIPASFYCETNDVFSARLQSLSILLERLPKLKEIFPLIIAIVGEIGNNSYNHNIGNWPDVPGIFFAYSLDKRQIVLADRGRGILKTLQRVVPNLKTDKEALNIAFTKYISGRAPENRGNGLKFVKDVISENPFQLQFYTGNAETELKQNTTELNIKTLDTKFHGCIAIIQY
ncbi:MAG: MerR family DNA-binding transcriptional regulator [Candidatus Peregrinibacteria bacterium]|nr:MerR family DNA-binding transcriptional regulator [Candidatus Peregrinibacteria bacterium]